MSEQCENCGRQIGKLETPQIHNGHVVCEECKSRLGGAIPYASPTASIPPRVVELTAKKWKYHQMVASAILLAMIVLTVFISANTRGVRGATVSDATVACIGLLIVALLYFLWSLFMSWWHHG